MNREDIKKWATQAQLPQSYETGEPMWLYNLERFAALVAAAEREAIYDLAMYAPFKKDADLLMPESEIDPDAAESGDFFQSAEFRYAVNNTVKATTFVICSAIRTRGQA